MADDEHSDNDETDAAADDETFIELYEEAGE